MATYIVYSVYGTVNGNVAHVATFAYSEWEAANRYAATLLGGYVLRDKVSMRTAPAARTQHATPDTVKVVPVSVVPPTAVRLPDELTISQVKKYRTEGWTG